MKKLVPLLVLFTLFVLGLFLVVTYVYLADKYCALEAETQALNLRDYRNEGEADASHSYGRRAQSQSDQAINVPALIQLAAANSEQPQGADDTENKSKKSHRWIVKFFCEAKAADAALVFFTYGLMIVTGWLAWATLKLWDASEKQAQLTKDALMAEQRGWIMVSLEIETLKFIGASETRSPDPAAELHIKVSNVGRTPALNATLHIAMLPDHGYSSVMLRDFADQNLDCFDGRFVSPREEYTLESTIVTGNGGELYRYGGRGEYRMLIVGCITYQIIQDIEAPKQTGFVYRLVAVNEDVRIYPDQGDLALDKVRAVIASGGFVT